MCLLPQLYKLTMQQAVLQHYPKVSVRYRKRYVLHPTPITKASS